jgi:hypothetical protein
VNGPGFPPPQEDVGACVDCARVHGATDMERVLCLLVQHNAHLEHIADLLEPMIERWHERDRNS